MKRGDNVWLFVHKQRGDGVKILAKGILILKHEGLWHIKTNKRFYRKKESELAIVREEDKELL